MNMIRKKHTKGPRYVNLTFLGALFRWWWLTVVGVHRKQRRWLFLVEKRVEMVWWWGPSLWLSVG